MNKLSSLALNDEGFVFDPTTGNSFTTNNIGLSIISYLKEGKNNKDILELLSTEFEIDSDTAQRDLNDFLAQLRVYRLFEGS